MSLVTPTILSAGQPLNPAYELLGLDITKEVNRIPYAQLVLLDGDAAQQQFALSDADFFKPGQVIEIKLHYPNESSDQATTVFKGVVVGQSVSADAQGSLLTVELKDAAIKLTAARKSVIYRDQTDDKAIGQIITNSGLKKGKIEATQTQHQELVQYYCTDWDFILARAEANGLLAVVDDGVISLVKLAIEGEPKHKFEYGRSEIFSFDMEADGGRQYPEVQSVGWDIKGQKLTAPAKARSFRLAQGNLDGAKIAKAVGSETYRLTTLVPLAPKELQAWSDAALARSRMAMIRGYIAVPGSSQIKLLDVIGISGIGKRFDGKTLVTGLRHRVDQHGWQTDVQFGLSPERFAERFDIADAPAAGLLPAVHGLQIGVVSQFEEDPAKEFRVKVALPGFGDKVESVWARLASPDAGKERGYFFRPEAGDEVVIGFFNDDPRQAVILGALYSSKNPPPKAVSKLAKENKDKAIVTKKGLTIRFFDDAKSALFIETPAANKIVLDDNAQTIQITDQHGNKVTLSKDGITIQSAKDLKIEASGKIEIKGQKVDVK
jgi:Rhs element Vgr protein